MVQLKQNSPEKRPENFEKESVSRPETSKTPEQEKPLEDIYEKVDTPEQIAEKEGASGSREQAGLVQGTNAQSEYEKRRKSIEKTLSKGLDQEFLKMPPALQQEFKRVGEETAVKINTMLDTGKAKARKIIVLIKKWLTMIPGVNKFFIEQEAKIKTDEIIKLQDKKS